MKVSPILAIILALVSLSLPACSKHDDHPEAEHHKIVLTSPKAMDVTVTQPYVCQIHSQRHIKVRALQSGYLQPIRLKEGQAVKEGEVLFEILPPLYQARYNAEKAEVQLAQIEFNNTQKLHEDKVVSIQQVLLAQAKLNKATAKMKLAEAELDFTKVTARFDGIINRLMEQQGSLVKEGDVLTTLSDNSVMWVYFNVPEKRYLEYKARRGRIQGRSQDISRLELVDARVELILADGSKFNQTASNTVTVEGQFNNETGNIAFRADFPNPDRLLRHGQTGTVLVRQTVHDALVIPQRATFEILAKRYVYVVDKDDVVHQRAITVEHELDDVFVIKKGLYANDRIVLEGVRQVHHGRKAEEYKFRKPEEAIANQKDPAE